jgi:hypothetical protein
MLMDSEKLDELDDVTFPDLIQDFNRSSELNDDKKGGYSLCHFGMHGLGHLQKRKGNNIRLYIMT